MKYLFLILILFSVQSYSQTVDIKPEDVTFDFMSSEGSFWNDCTHKKLSEPHQWEIKCPDSTITFRVHLLLREYFNDSEVTYEFHFWADRDQDKKTQTRTQSTWLTVDKGTKTRKIIGYLGFDEDTTQFRIEIRPKK